MENVPSSLRPMNVLFPFVAKIEGIEWWRNPLPIHDVKNELEFITDKNNFGLFLRLGVRYLTEKDYRTIVEHGNR